MLALTVLETSTYALVQSLVRNKNQRTKGALLCQQFRNRQDQDAAAAHWLLGPAIRSRYEVRRRLPFQHELLAANFGRRH
jgi:hypothetical protein